MQGFGVLRLRASVAQGPWVELAGKGLCYPRPKGLGFRVFRGFIGLIGLVGLIGFLRFIGLIGRRV